MTQSKAYEGCDLSALDKALAIHSMMCRSSDISPRRALWEAIREYNLSLSPELSEAQLTALERERE